MREEVECRGAERCPPEKNKFCSVKNPGGLGEVVDFGGFLLSLRQRGWRSAERRRNELLLGQGKGTLSCIQLCGSLQGYARTLMLGLVCSVKYSYCLQHTSAKYTVQAPCILLLFLPLPTSLCLSKVTLILSTAVLVER